MVALRRTAGVTLSGLVASVLMPLGARAGQIHVTKALFSNLPPHADRACVTWTAPRQAANLASPMICRAARVLGRAGLHERAVR
jgi:hypothetical protein